MIVLRSALFNVAFMAWTTLSAISFLLVLPLPRRVICKGISAWAAVALWLLKVIIGVETVVRGREHIPDGPALIASKHQSAWETVAFHHILAEPAFVVKKELLHIPVYGWAVLKSGSIPVDRKGGARALRRVVREAAAAIARGQQLVIFPEGTRTAPGRRRPYQPGVGALYTHLGVPVVPVALNSGLVWGRRRFIKRPGHIVVEFLPPISPGLVSRVFLAELEDRIESASAALLATASVEDSVDNPAFARDTPVEPGNR